MSKFEITTTSEMNNFLETNVATDARLPANANLLLVEGELGNVTTSELDELMYVSRRSLHLC
jgi:hypothetical protein